MSFAYERRYCTMEDSRFIELVEREKGFEFCQAFRDEVD